MNSWWETPLYSKFLNDIGEVIDTGNIVLLFTPKHIPDRFLSELKIALSNASNHVIYEKINLEDIDILTNKPIESLLFSHFEFDTITDEFIPKKASSIFKNIDNNPERIIVFENISISILDMFREFIIDLGRYFSSENIYERHKVIVIIDPKVFEENDFANESGIVKVFFQECFDKLDYNLGLRYYHNYQAGKFTHLNENIIAALSLFDAKLADELTECKNLIEDYPKTLIEYAKENQWENLTFKNIEKLTEKEIWELWSYGILDFKNNKKYYHSAYLKIHNQDLELSSRIWGPGVGVLIPQIEEIRIRLLNCRKIYYPENFISNRVDVVIENKMDLEIGEIYHFVNKRIISFKWFSKSEIEQVKYYIKLCRDIRNDLSHLRIPASSNISLFIQQYEQIIRLLESSD